MMAFGMLLAIPLMLLVPVVLAAVPIWLVIWLARGTNPLAGRPIFVPSAPAVTTVCPNCHRGLQPGWQHCAYCGQKLT